MDQPRTTETLSSWERAAVAGFFIVAIAVSAVVVMRPGEPPGDVVGPVDERPSVADTVPRPITLLDAYEVALEWAREWHPDAWPILISSQFEIPPEATQATPQATHGYHVFTFAAPQEGGEWRRLNLAVSRQSGTIYHEDELASSVEPPNSIDELLTDLPVSAEQAFDVADRVVGEGYRAGCDPSRRQAQVVLDATDRDAPAWVVVYFDQRERSVNDIVVRIDAHTGRTSTEVRDDTSCEAG
jgi:hypothetical protein